MSRETQNQTTLFSILQQYDQAELSKILLVCVTTAFGCCDSIKIFANVIKKIIMFALGSSIRSSPCPASFLSVNPPCVYSHSRPNIGTANQQKQYLVSQILARLWRHSSGGAIHKLATCSRLPPPDAAPGPHVIVAAGRNEAAIWDLSKGGACKQARISKNFFSCSLDVGYVCDCRKERKRRARNGSG